MRRAGWFAWFALVTVAFPGIARANPMDLTLSRLWDRECARGARNPARWWDECDHGDQAAFRELASEYGYAIAPPLLAPAETLGYAGFYLALEGFLTVINSSDDSNNVWVRGTEDQNPDDVLFVSSIHARKGLPFSFELGTSLSYVASTEQVLLGADVRWTLLEGYREGWQGYFPDIAFRASVNRLMGEDELDMTVIGSDVSLSRPWAISGMMTITPYVGYQWLRIIADNSLVLNGGPEDPDNQGGSPTILECDAETHTECVGGVGGPGDIAYLDFDRENIDRHRIFLGIRFLYEHLSAALQVGIDPKSNPQTGFGVTIGLDY